MGDSTPQSNPAEKSFPLAVYMSRLFHLIFAKLNSSWQVQCQSSWTETSSIITLSPPNHQTTWASVFEPLLGYLGSWNLVWEALAFQKCCQFKTDFDGVNSKVGLLTQNNISSYLASPQKICCCLLRYFWPYLNHIKSLSKYGQLN